MKKMRDMLALTEMEGGALAMIARNGPVTPYAVREMFRTSPTDFWSGSKGAVYPLMKRLQERGLISSSADQKDGRNRQVYEVTSEGKAALTRWLTDAERACRLGFDPLRTRLFFIDALTPAQRKKFLQNVEERLKIETVSPRPDDQMAVTLHKAWEQFRLSAFRKFAGKLKSKRGG